MDRVYILSLDTLFTRRFLGGSGLKSRGDQVTQLFTHQMVWIWGHPSRSSSCSRGPGVLERTVAIQREGLEGGRKIVIVPGSVWGRRPRSSRPSPSVALRVALQAKGAVGGPLVQLALTSSVLGPGRWSPPALGGPLSVSRGREVRSRLHTGSSLLPSVPKSGHMVQYGRNNTWFYLFRFKLQIGLLFSIQINYFTVYTVKTHFSGRTFQIGPLLASKPATRPKIK